MEQARELEAQGRLREALMVSLGALLQALNHLQDSLLGLQMNLKRARQEINHEAPGLRGNRSQTLPDEIPKKLRILH
jgi:hypothetical protein